jgi:GTP-binding protein YchF
MGFSCGIVGLPNVGKSTLFNALTAAGVPAENYPFCTIDPNVGVIPVRDDRLERIAASFHPEKTTPTVIEFVDIAGLVKGASKGEGLGNQFLSHIREVDAICHVVRCFEDPNVMHVDPEINPRRDIELVETELILKDLETVERKLGDAQKRAKGGDKKTKQEVDYLTGLRDLLAGGRPVESGHAHTPEEAECFRDLHLLTAKPVLYVANIGESEIGKENRRLAMVRDIAAARRAPVIVLSAGIEAELTALPPEERAEFLSGLGIAESGLDRLVHAGYALLELITFFTVNEKEARARTVKRGTTAPAAAGTIHTDFEKGFIRAEVTACDDLFRLGSEQAVRDQGLLRSEGRDYVVQDGDIILFRFHV